MVPTFYDSIEIKSDSMARKFHGRVERFTAVPAFVMTLVEVILFLTFIRLIYRLVMRLVRLATGRSGKAKTMPAPIPAPGK